MKKLIASLVLLAILAFPINRAFATVKQVTSVGATASTILTPGLNVHTIVIQNNGSGNVRISIDGTNSPTASTGYKLVAGSYLILSFSGSKGPPLIKAILESGTTTTLDIITDDTGSS